MSDFSKSTLSKVKGKKTKPQSTCIMYTIIIGMYQEASIEKPQFLNFFFLKKGPVEKRYCSE